MKTTPAQKAVHNELTGLEGHRLNEIKDAYYGVAGNLPALAHALELADLDLGGEAGPLLDLHLAACEMLEGLKKLKALGQYL